MFILRTLSFRDVVHALQQRKVGVAIDISKNLVSNAVNTAKFRIQLHPRFPVQRKARRAP